MKLDSFNLFTAYLVAVIRLPNGKVEQALRQSLTVPRCDDVVDHIQNHRRKGDKKQHEEYASHRRNTMGRSLLEVFVQSAVSTKVLIGLCMVSVVIAGVSVGNTLVHRCHTRIESLL